MCLTESVRTSDEGKEKGALTTADGAIGILKCVYPGGDAKIFSV